MNICIFSGRLTKDPEYRSGEKPLAKYTIAVDRFKKGESDFISCVAFGNNADFAQRYLTKGMKVIVNGHLQTGSYEKDGRKVYTTDLVIDRQEFAERKESNSVGKYATPDPEGFMEIPKGFEEELPFN